MREMTSKQGRTLYHYKLMETDRAESVLGMFLVDTGRAHVVGD